MSLRKLPSLEQTFGPELGGQAVAPASAELLEMFWPEAFESTQGVAVMPAEDAARLERLFERFGVPMQVSHNSLKTIGRAYDVFCLGLGPMVERRLRAPDNFRAFLHDWPQDWFDYLEAVATGDLAAARQWAVKLQPLSPDCQYPPGVRVDWAPKG